MEVELPENGCNVYLGDYLDNYYNNVRTRYYFNNGKLVESSKNSYATSPSGYHCLTSEEKIYYKSELSIYFPFISFIIILCAYLLVYKVLIKRLLP